MAYFVLSQAEQLLVSELEKYGKLTYGEHKGSRAFPNGGWKVELVPWNGCPNGAYAFGDVQPGLCQALQSILDYMKKQGYIPR